MNFESNFNIDDKVLFQPMQRHCDALGIEKSKSFGKIIAIRFTKAKVFYDIIDDYYGRLFDNVDSNYVFPNEQNTKIKG